MDIRELPKVVVLICVVTYASAGTTVDSDGNPDGAQNDGTMLTSPKDGNYKLSYADYEMTWRNFKVEYNKMYASTSEENRRFAIFMDNVKTIEAHNMKYHLGQSTYWMGINHFSDWTQEEFQAWLGPRDKNVHSRSKRQADNDMVYNPIDDKKLPQAINWTAKGFVTDIKNQGNCGSCYAFSTTGAVEGQWKRKRGKLINLSEQQIVDCSRSFGNFGCGGGNPVKGFEYIISAGGLQDETTYPYVAKENTCEFNESLVVAQIENYYTVAENEAALKSAVGLEGPISVSVYASSNFGKYEGGIFNDSLCVGNFHQNHAMLVVGYGSSDGKDYWIVKNCHGTLSNWGEYGYMRMARNTGTIGMCGIAEDGSFPVVSDGSNTLGSVITILVTSTFAILNFKCPCF